MDRIDDSSIATLHAAFVAAREEFEAAVQLAEGRWEDKILEPEDGDDEPWPPHMAAGHALIGERWRFRHISSLLAQPTGAEPLSGEAFAATPAGQEEIATRSEQYNALTGPTETIAAAAREWERIDAVYAQLDAEDLTHAAGMNDGQLGYLASMGHEPSNDVRGALLLAVVHLRDHAQQLRAVLAP